MEDDNIIFAEIDSDINHFEELYPGTTNEFRKQYYNADTFNLLKRDHTDLKILHLNIRSVNTSIDEFSAFLGDLHCKFDVMCLTESWLTKSTAQLYHFDGYKSFHSLRPNNHVGGGVTAFISNKYNVKIITEQTMCTDNIETLFLEASHRHSGQTYHMYCV